MRAYFTRFDMAQIFMTAARGLGHSPTLYIGNEGWKVRW